MNLQEYQPLARRTMKELPLAEHIEHMGIGVTGELGEIADAIKKFSIYGKGVDPQDPSKELRVADGGVMDLVNLAEEGGDAWWYIVGLQPEVDASLLVMERTFEAGVQAAETLQWAGFSLARLAVRIQRNMALNADVLLGFGGKFPERSTATHYVNAMCFDMGVLYGKLGITLSASLKANVEKLAKRYGDKYSDCAALNRDTDAERAVLEANLPGVAA